jgi:arylsulfatase A-like enzyme
VPFFAHWPGKIKAGTTEHVTPLYDFLATAGDLAGVDSIMSDGISFLPTLLGRSEEQEKHDYLYWENSTMKPHAQSVRMGDYYSYRSHPDSLTELYNLNTDPFCKVDISKDNTVIVKQVESHMTAAHEDSQWYINPGESKEVIAAKRQKAERTGTIQKPSSPNSKY